MNECCRGLNCANTALIKAHIIPKGFARLARGDGNVISVHPGRKPSVAKYQLGAFDPSILCASCDGTLGRYDDYAVEFCRDFAEKRKPYSDLGFEVPDVDTDLLRKGILAIIWRASISDQAECKNVALGPYEELACKVLFGQSSLDQFPHFQIVAQRYVTGKEHVGFYLFPYSTRFDGLNVYVMGLVGLRFIVKMDARPLPSEMQHFAIGNERQVLGTNVDFDDASEGRALRRKANVLWRYRTNGK